MQTSKKKMKKVLVSLTGVALAIMLLVGGNLGLFAQAQESEAASTVSLEIPQESGSQQEPGEDSSQTEELENESTEIVESEEVESSDSSSIQQDNSTDSVNDATSEQNSTVSSEENSTASSEPVKSSSDISSKDETSSVVTSSTVEEEEVTLPRFVAPSPYANSDAYVVTADNFLEAFTLEGASATANAYTITDGKGVLTLTRDGIFNDKGSATLNTESGFDTSQGFTFKGGVLLTTSAGIANPSDGIILGFHNDPLYKMGSSQWNLGLGGLDDGFGFKFDTVYNAAIGVPIDPAVSTMTQDGSGVVTGSNSGSNVFNKAFAGFVRNDFTVTDTSIDFRADGRNTGLARTWMGPSENPTDPDQLLAAALERPKIIDTGNVSGTDRVHGQWLNFELIYNGKTKVMTVTTSYELPDASGSYEGPSFQKDLSEWVGDNETMQFFVAGSTGSYKVGQKVRIDRFEYVVKASINFDTGVETIANPASIEGLLAGQSFTLPAAPSIVTRKGYEFGGWKDLNKQGDDGKYVEGSTVVLPSAGITYTAQWDPHKYTLQFTPGDGGTGTMPDQVVEYNDSSTYEGDAISESTFVKDGYHFIGWKTTVDGQEKTFKTTDLVKNLTDENNATFTLEAQWAPNTYEVAFMGNPGENQTVSGTMANQEFTYDESPKLLTTNGYSIPGYHLTGWNTQADGSGTPYQVDVEYSNLTKIDKDTITIYAQWAPNDYEVVFDANTGTGTMANQSFTYDEEAKLLSESTFTKEGYTQLGWSTVQNPIEGDGSSFYNLDEAYTNLTEEDSITLFAQWGANEYTVIFNKNDDIGDTKVQGTMPPQGFKYDQEQALTKNVYTRNNYTFEGWNTEADGQGTPYADEALEKNLVSTGNIILYAQWKPSEITINFDAQGGTTTQEPITGYLADQTVDLSGVPDATRTGYTFGGWYISNTDYTEENKMGTSVVLSDDVVVSNQEVTYYAKWTANQYFITFNGNGSTEGTMEQIKVSYDQENVTLPLNEFTKEGYTFGGWMLNQNGTESDYSDQANVVNWTSTDQETIPLFALWIANDYKVKFDGNGANADSPIMADQDFTYDVEEALNPNVFERDGYEFDGWNTQADGSGTTYVDKEVVKTLGGKTENGEVVTLFAQWKGLEQSVRFVAKDGDTGVTGLPASIPYSTGDSVTLEKPVDPTREGYTFAGWEDQANPGTIIAFPHEFTMPAGNVVYQATWTANEYEVVFNGNGADADSPTMQNQQFTYDEPKKLLTPNAFEKTGYHFTGWNTKPDGSGVDYDPTIEVNNLTTVSTEEEKLFNLYAQWEANTYIVTFDANTGTGTMADQTFIYDADPQELTPNAFTKTNYAFDSWNTEKDGSGVKYEDKESVNNVTGKESITLYAQWKDTFSITANDVIVQKSEIENLAQSELDDLIKQKSNAEGTINANNEETPVTVQENNVINAAGTYKVVFECNGVTKEIKVTVQDADEITVGAQEAIQANNIWIQSSQVGKISDEEYKSLSSAKAWKIDFSNTNVEVYSVDASKVLAKEGTYPIYYATQAGTIVEAFVAVTNAENANVENQEAIQANNIVVKLSEANAIDYIQKSGAKAWAANTSPTAPIDVLVDDTNVLMAVGTYPVVYKTDTDEQTQVTGLVTIYDADHVTVDISSNESIQVNDFTFNANDLANLTVQEATNRANPTAWSADGLNTSVDIASIDLSKVKAAKGVYPIVYTATNGTQVTGYVGVGKGDVVQGNDQDKEVVQANHFVVQGADVANGISQTQYIEHADANAFTWDTTGKLQKVNIPTVDASAVLSTYGTYPVKYTTANANAVDAMATVQTADEITVQMDKDAAIQADNFKIKVYQVENNELTPQFAFEEGHPVAWTTDGQNQEIEIDINATDFSKVKPEVGHYPVTFYTTGENPISVEVDLEVSANNITLVTFDGNGATTQANPKVIGVEEPSTIMDSLPEQPKRTGHTFTGWNTSADGKGAAFDANSTVTAPMTVYAQWRVNNYIVNFDTQSTSENPAEQSITYNTLINKPATDPVKKGHSFVGWFTQPTGGIYWDFSTDTMPADNMTLYAQYEVNSYIVTFNSNNGNDDTYQSVVYDTQVVKPSDPKLYGYTFLGWFDEKGKEWDFATPMPDENITLTAKWEHTEYRVTFMSYDLQTTLAEYPLYAGDQIPAVNAPNVGGFHFASWVEEVTDIKWTAYSMMPDRNLVLVATYDQNKSDESNTDPSGKPITDKPSNSKVNTPANSQTVPPASSKSVASSTVTSVTSTTSSVGQTTSEVTASEVITSEVITSEVTTSVVSSGTSSKETIETSTIPGDIVTDVEEWSLVSLILAIAGVIMSVILLVTGLKKNNKLLFGIIGAIIGLIGVALFFVLNNIFATMVIFNFTSLFFVAIIILQIVMLVLTKGEQEDDDNQEVDA